MNKYLNNPDTVPAATNSLIIRTAQVDRYTKLICFQYIITKNQERGGKLMLKHQCVMEIDRNGKEAW